MIIRGRPHGSVFRVWHSLAVRDSNDQLLTLSRYSFDGPRSWRETNVSHLVGGQLIRSDPHFLGSIIARGPNDELLEFSPFSQGDQWRLVNLSNAVAGGRLITGTPHGYGLDDTRHIVARGQNDELLEWWWSPQHGWEEVVNVSAAVGGQLIRSDPWGYTLDDTQHIVARGPNDELLEFWHPGDQWRLVNLSNAVAGGRLITGTPHGYTLDDTQHIVARGANDELLEWWWNPQHGWEEVVNLSAAVGGQLIRSDPWGYKLLDDTQHIVARGANDELLEWYWTREDGWGVLDVSAAVDGQLIRGRPYGYSWLLPPDHVLDPDFNALVDSQHIVTQGLNGELLEWYWLPESSWRKQRVRPTEAEWIEAVLNVMMS